MLTAESSGSVLANVIPLASGATETNSGGTGGVRRQLDRSAASANRNDRYLGKGRQYSVKTFRSLVVVLLLGAVGCREKPIDYRAHSRARASAARTAARGRAGV